MYAIVTTGGKQYKVEKDMRVKVEKLDAKVGDKINVYVVDVNIAKEKVAFSVREFKKKQQRDEISQYMSKSNNDDDGAYTLGDFIKNQKN